MDLSCVSLGDSRCLMRKQRRRRKEGGEGEGGRQVQGGRGREEEGIGGMGGVSDVFKTLSCSSSSSLALAFSLHLTCRPSLALHSGKNLCRGQTLTLFHYFLRFLLLK